MVAYLIMTVFGICGLYQNWDNVPNISYKISNIFSYVIDFLFICLFAWLYKNADSLSPNKSIEEIEKEMDKIK